MSLGELALDRRSHLSALWWLGLLYRRPLGFRNAVEELGRRKGFATALRIYLHQFPYMLLVCILGHGVFHDLLGFEVQPGNKALDLLLAFHGWGIAFGVAGGITLGLVLGLAAGDPEFKAHRIADLGLAVAIAFGIIIAIGAEASGAIGAGISFGLAFGIFVAIARGSAFEDIEGRAFEVNAGITVAIVSGIICGVGIGLIEGLTLGIGSGIGFAVVFAVAVLRLYYLPVQIFLAGARPRSNWYRYHPVAWDDLCSITFPGLDRLLVAYAEKDPASANREIERLIDTYPSQRLQALRARATLLARRVANAHLSRLDETLAALPEGEEGFLAQTRRLRDLVHEIAALQAHLDTVDRPGLREPLARLLVREIESFHDQIGGFRQPLAREFRRAAGKWLEVAEEQLAATRVVLDKEPTRQVFRAGDPVDRDNEAFVPRDAITGEIQSQVMLANGCPGLVLYGRRRTGKSTILVNLEGALPKVRTTTISMQDPAATSSLDDLIGLLVTKVRAAAGLRGQASPGRNLTGLFSALARANGHLAKQDRRFLLAIDEYENLDRKIGEGVFPLDLLDTVRESIQSHRRITWIFAGSHLITELPNAEWASYLVSARTVEVGPFTPAEARLLLTEPLKYSTLWPKDDPTRPRFDPGFWGEGGIERIHAEAGGWPHLVQLIAETIVDLLNYDQRTQVDGDIMERALEKTIVHGHTVLHQLMRGESTLPGEWDYLSAFRSRDTQPPPDDEALARSLRHRLLIAEEGADWRLRVPLMHRWLRQRG